MRLIPKIILALFLLNIGSLSLSGCGPETSDKITEADIAGVWELIEVTYTDSTDTRFYVTPADTAIWIDISLNLNIAGHGILYFGSDIETVTWTYRDFNLFITYTSDNRKRIAGLIIDGEFVFPIPFEDGSGIEWDAFGTMVKKLEE